MNYVLAIGLGMPELLIIFAVVLLLFGSTRLPQLAKGLGKSINEFKKGTRESTDTEEIDSPSPRRESLRASSITMEEDRLAASKIASNEQR